MAYPPAYPQQVSAVPVSAYPTTGYPTTGYPGYPYPAPAPKLPTKKGPWLWVLAVTCGVLALGTGALGFLSAADSSKTDTTVSALTEEITELEADVRRAERNIDSLEDDVAQYEGTLTDTQDELTDLQACPAAVQEWVDADISGTDAEFQAAVQNLIDLCHL
jgi:hypothetical protein